MENDYNYIANYRNGAAHCSNCKCLDDFRCKDTRFKFIVEKQQKLQFYFKQSADFLLFKQNSLTPI